MPVFRLVRALVVCTVVTAFGVAGSGAGAAMMQLPNADGCLSSTAAAAEGDCTRSLRALNGAQGLAISPDGANVYVAGGPAEGGLLIFDRDPATGAVTQKAGTAGCIVDRGNATPDPTCAQGQLIGNAWGGGNPVTVSPDGNNVYLVSAEYGSISVFDRDPTTGALTQKAGTAGCIQQSTNGNRRPNDCDKTGRGMAALLTIVISPDGKNAYGSTWSNSIVTFDRNVATGTLTQKSGGAGCFRSNTNESCTALTTPVELSQTQNLIVSTDGNHVYATSYTRGRIWLFDRNATTGDLTPVTCFEAIGGTGQCAAASGVAALRGFDTLDIESANVITQSPDGRTIYASGYAKGIAILQRDPTTGFLSQAAGTAGCIADVAAAGAAFSGCATARGMNTDFFQLAVASDAAYLMSNTQDAILVFARDSATGALTQSSGTDGCFANAASELANCTVAVGLDGVMRVAVSPDGATLYAMAGTSQALTVFDTDGIPGNPGSDSATGDPNVADATPVAAPTTTSTLRLRSTPRPRLQGTVVRATCAASRTLRSCSVVVSVPAGALERSSRLRARRVVIGRRTVTVTKPRRSITVAVPLTARGSALARRPRSAGSSLARVTLTARATDGSRAVLRHTLRLRGSSTSASAVTG
jgi:DNA-binding beta-propeller fold protein YncE